VKRAAFREGEERRVLRALASILVLVAWAGGVPACAQVASKSAAVTLVARVQESFTLFPTPIPALDPDSDQPGSNPQGVQVVLSWRLHHGRSFQVGYDLTDESGNQPATLSSGVVVPSRISAVPLVYSFLPVPSALPGIVGGWGNRETDPSGVAGFSFLIPFHYQAERPTLRLRAIVL
jgi:hypothetical protein